MAETTAFGPLSGQLETASGLQVVNEVLTTVARQFKPHGYVYDQLVAPQLGPYQLQGMLDVTSDHLALNATGMNGQVTVDWSGAASALSEIRPLGNYRIVLKGHGAGVDAKLSTLSGKLLLSATGSFDQVNGMLVNGTAQAAPGAAAAELNELLHHLGPEISPGVFKLAVMPQPVAAH